MLTKKRLPKQYRDHPLQTTTECTLVLHWHKLPVSSQAPLNAQSLKYITVALSLSQFSLKCITAPRLLNSWNAFENIPKPKTLLFW